MGLKEKVKLLDFFGGSATLKLNGEDSFKTCVGVIYSLLFIGSIAAASYYYGDNYLKNASPTVQYLSKTLSKQPVLNFGQKGLFFYTMF